MWYQVVFMVGAFLVSDVLDNNQACFIMMTLSRAYSAVVVYHELSEGSLFSLVEYESTHNSGYRLCFGADTFFEVLH